MMIRPSPWPIRRRFCIRRRTVDACPKRLNPLKRGAIHHHQDLYVPIFIHERAACLPHLHLGCLPDAMAAPTGSTLSP